MSDVLEPSLPTTEAVARVHAEPRSAPARAQHSQEFSLGWCDALLARRAWVWALIVLLHLLSFNGIWRIGLDSVLYRGVGESLAQGLGYTFVGQPHDHVYPGIPLLVALCRWFFEDVTLPVLLVINACSLAALWFMERLVALHYPRWLALLVVLGVALNGRYLMYAQEIMTDVPFAMAFAGALYAWERWRMARGAMKTGATMPGVVAARTHGWPWLALLVGMMLLAALLRPTFWVLLAAALAAALVRGLARLDRRGIQIALASTVILVLVCVMLANDALRQLLLGGAYAREVTLRIERLGLFFFNELEKTFTRDLNNAFFGQHMSPIGPLFSIGLLLCVLLVARRKTLWAMPVYFMLAVTMLHSSEPRYYMFVLPVLWLGWLLMLVALAKRSHALLRGGIVMVGALLPVVLNSGHVVTLIYEQRRGDFAMLAGQDREEVFFERYRDGSIPRLRAIAAMIREHVPEDVRVIGPDGTILSYLTGRRVAGDREILLGVPEHKHARAVRDYGAGVWVFQKHLYRNDEKLHKLIHNRTVRPLDLIARDGPDYLATARIIVREK